MLAVLLHPTPPSRIRRARGTPRAAPVVALRAPALRLHLTPPPTVTAPPRATRRRPAAEVAALPPPVLRLVVATAPPPARLVLRAPAPLAAPIVEPTEAAVPIATAVGIQGTGGTRVIMVPADLTQPGIVNITHFRVAVAAGVW